MTAKAPGPKRDRYQIENVLLSELNVAAERQKRALDECPQVVTGGAPSDRGAPVERSPEARTKIIGEYQIALKRLKLDYPNMQRSLSSVLSVLILLFGLALFLGALFQQ